VGLEEAARKAGVPAVLNRVGSMLGLFFTSGPVRNFSEAKSSDLDLFASYYRGMLESGIYLPPSQFEVVFVSAAHEEAEIDRTIAAAETVLAGLGRA